MVMGCSTGVHYGTVWKPDRLTKKAHPQLNEYQIAVNLGLTIDPQPMDSSSFALVQLDDRPGTLRVHPWHELKVIEQ